MNPSREKIKECFEEMRKLMPENVEGLKTVRINELLYQKLPFKAWVNDQRIRGINTYFTWGVGPLVAVLDKLIDFEASMIAFPTDRIVHDEGKLIIQGSQINLTEICQ